MDDAGRLELAGGKDVALWCYFLLGIVLWLSARKTYPEVNPFLYLLPPLFLVSDDQHVIHASLVMLELPAILLAMVSLLSLTIPSKNLLPGVFLSLRSFRCFAS